MDSKKNDKQVEKKLKPTIASVNLNDLKTKVQAAACHCSA